MKNWRASEFLMAGVMVLIIAITLSNTVLGQEAVLEEGKTGTLEELVDQLAENQLKMVELLEKALKIKPKPDESMLAMSSMSAPFETCYQDYTSWPSSDTYKEDSGPFAMPFVNGSASTSEIYIDINGDGLTDFIHADNDFGVYALHSTCIMLGNGSGYDTAYRCRGRYENGPQIWTYYGDCADLS